MRRRLALAEATRVLDILLGCLTGDRLVRHGRHRPSPQGVSHDRPHGGGGDGDARERVDSRAGPPVEARARDPRRRRRVRARLLRQPRRRLSRRLRAPGAWPAALAPPRGFRTRRHPRPVSRRAPLRPRVRARVDGGDPRGGAQRVGRVPRRATPVPSQTPIPRSRRRRMARATLVCDDTRDAETLRSLCPEQSVAVLCERRVDETDPWPRSVDGEELPVAVAGFVERVMPREGFVNSSFTSRTPRTCARTPPPRDGNPGTRRFVVASARRWRRSRGFDDRFEARTVADRRSTRRRDGRG